MTSSAAEQKSWTDDATETLRGLWLTTSASKIAAILGGLTSNAVIAKARRLKLPPKGGPIKPSALKQGLPHASQRSKTQHPARLAGKSAGAIHVRRESSQAAADTGAGTAPHRPPAPVPFAPRDPKPWIDATGCQYHVEMSRFLEPGEHTTMLVCDEPLAGHARYRRYCEHHVPKHVERVA